MTVFLFVQYYFRETSPGDHPEIKWRLKLFSLAAVSNLPTGAGRKAEISIYRAANKVFKFN